MAIRNYNDNAWENIASLVCPEVDGARESAECAKAWVDGAWENVWIDKEFIVQAGNNCSISNGVVTMAFTWEATTGNGGEIYIAGEFEAGESYEISMTCKTGATTLNVIGHTITGGTENYSYFAFSSTGQTKSVTITPAADLEKVAFIFTAGGGTGGSYSGSLWISWSTTLNVLTKNRKEKTNENINDWEYNF